MGTPTVICLTPVKNEAWILGRFLACASMWADVIIVADQNSQDGSAEIARGFSKVRLVRNESDRFNEPERVSLLIEESRKIAGPRLLIPLDADEFLTSNFLNSPEWETALGCKEGTVIRFDWANIVPGMTHCWLSPERVFGFMDDGSPYQGPSESRFGRGRRPCRPALNGGHGGPPLPGREWSPTQKIRDRIYAMEH